MLPNLQQRKLSIEAPFEPGEATGAPAPRVRKAQVQRAILQRYDLLPERFAQQQVAASPMREYFAAEKQNMGIKRTHSKESFKFSPQRSPSTYKSPDISPRINGVSNAGLPVEQEATQSQENEQSVPHSEVGTPRLDARTMNTLHPDVLNAITTELSEMKSQNIMKERLIRAKRKLSTVGVFKASSKQLDTAKPLTFEEQQRLKRAGIEFGAKVEHDAAYAVTFDEHGFEQHKPKASFDLEAFANMQPPYQYSQETVGMIAPFRRDSRSVLLEKEAEYSEANRNDLALRAQHTTMLSSEKKKQVASIARQKFMLNFSPQNGMGATLQPEPSRITLANRSFLEPSSTKHDTSKSKGHIKNLAQEIQQKKVALELNIKASKAFDIRQHKALWEIIAALETSAALKQKDDLEATEPVKRGDDEDRQKFLEQQQLLKDTNVRDVVKLGDKGRFKSIRGRRGGSVSHAADDDDDDPAVRKYREMIKAREIRARSSKRPALNTSPSSRALNTDDKRFQKLITLENQHNAKSRQTTLPQISQRRCSGSGIGYIGSYAHLQEQWKDINGGVVEKRRFVRDFAKQQLTALDADDVRRHDTTFQEQLAATKERNVALDRGDFLGSFKAHLQHVTSSTKARRPAVLAQHIPSQILNGIEENRALLEELREEKGRNQKQLDAAKTKEQEMRDSGLVYPKRVTDQRNKVSKHEQMQRLFDHPQQSSKKKQVPDLLVAKELLTQENSRSQERNASKEGASQDKSPHKEEVDTSKPKLDASAMTHVKLINIKDQLFDLILAHVRHQKANPGKAINILPGDFELSSYTRGDVQKVFKSDIYRLFGMQEPTDGEQDSMQSMRHKKIKQLTLGQLSSRQYAPPKVEVPGAPKTYSPRKARNYIQEALEELPQSQLVKLVEILYESSKGDNKAGGTFQLQHFGSFISGIGQGADIDSQLSQGKFMSPSVSQSSHLSEIGQVNPHTIGVKCKINTFKSKVMIKKKEGPDTAANSGYLDRINDLARNATLNNTDSILMHQGFELRDLTAVPSMQRVDVENALVYDAALAQIAEEDHMATTANQSTPTSPFKSPFLKKRDLDMKPSEVVFLDNNPDYKIGSSNTTSNEPTFAAKQSKRKGQMSILGIFEDFTAKDDTGKYKKLLQERHKLDDAVFANEDSKKTEDKLTAPDILKDFNEQILNWRYRLCPTFSGDLAQHLQENTQKVPEILLQGRMASGSNSGRLSPISSAGEESCSVDVDFVDQRISRMNSIDVTPTISKVTGSLRAGSNIESRASSPRLNRDESVLRIRANKRTPDLSQGTQDYYQGVIDSYRANQDMQREFKKLIQNNKTNLDLSALGAKRNKMFVQIDLSKMAKQYQSGAYYLIRVAMHCIQKIKAKHNSVFHNKKKPDASKSSPKMQHQQIVYNESPFAKVEEHLQVQADAANIMPLFCSHITFSTGATPSTRKFAAGAQARGRFYLFGGQSISLLCDMKSYSFAQNSWNIESQRGLAQSETLSPARSEMNSALSRSAGGSGLQQHPLAVISERCQHTMSTFMNRYMVVFGGAGELIPMLNRRETFNDLYVWDTHQDYKEGNARWVDMNDQEHQYNPLKLDIMRAARLDPDAPVGTNPDLQECSPPLRRAQHVAGIYGGCLLIHGGFYGEDNRVLSDFAMYDIALGRWIKCKQPKKLALNNGLGARCMHSMTVVQEPRVVARKRNSRLMWLYDPASLIRLEYEDDDEAASGYSVDVPQPLLKHSGIFVFGGLMGQMQESVPGQVIATQLKRQPQNDLYLITPCYQRNQKYLTREAANFKKAVKTQICFQVQKLEPMGRPPLPRYSHGACFIRKYFVVHGGRNDDLFQTSMKNIGLNDLHLYDTEKNMWMGLAIFDSIPPSRWAHQLVAEQTYDEDYQGSRIYVFGGVNLLQYSDSTIYCFDIDEGKVSEFLESGEQAIDDLERMGSYKIKSSFTSS